MNKVVWENQDRFACVAEIHRLEAELGSLLLRVQQFDQHVSAVGHHIGAVCGGVDVDTLDKGGTAAVIIAKFDALKAELARCKARTAAVPPSAMPKHEQLQDPDPMFWFGEAK